MHLINLVFHEAGHILFAPFGSFMMSLGGSLLQVIVAAVQLMVGALVYSFFVLRSSLSPHS